MLKNKILKILLALTPMVPLFSMVNITSCSSEASNIDGTNWIGVTRGSFAENDYFIDEVNETITYISTVSIHAYNLVIPNYVKWHKKQLKVYLAPRAFKNNAGIAGTVELNDFIIEIPDECFSGCISMTGFIFHKYPIAIGNLAFAGCLILSQILVLNEGEIHEDWANSLRSIGNFAFTECVSLIGELVLGNDLTSIGEYAFQRCTGLSSVNLQFCFNLGYINRGAFAACSGIQIVYLSRSIKGIGDEVFKGCTFLSTINAPIRNMTLTLGNNTFYGCENLTTFTNNIHIDSFGQGCFSFTPKLHLPLWDPKYEINVIPPFAFSSCGRTTLKFEPNTESWHLDVQDYAFSNNHELSYIDFSDFPVGPPPEWTGQDIFTGCAKQGVIIINEANVLNEEWNEFFAGNDIEISNDAWKIKTKRYQINSVTKPTNQASAHLDPSGTTTIEILDFQCDIKEGFDPQYFKLSYNPYYYIQTETGRKKVYLDGEKILSIDFHDDDPTKFDLKIILNGAKTGTYFAQMNFFYHDRKVYCTDSDPFTLILDN